MWLVRRGRWFWAVALTLAAGMVAWIATRVVIHAAAGPAALNALTFSPSPTF